MSSQELSLALKLAKQAGELISEQRKSLQISFKGDVELVTQADVAADKLITNGIVSTYPDHAILSEELNPNLTDELPDHLWIIDPIDGTVNFAHQHYQVAISIAYYYKGCAQVGVVHNPFTEETFHAEAGQGAWLNDQPIQCSDQSDLQRALVATGFPYVCNDMDKLIARIRSVLENCADLRRLGAAALDICWVACGRMDAYYENVQPWDMAAAQLIAREAGATFGHIYELPLNANRELVSKDVLISTPACFEGIKSLLQQADQQA